uniref:Tail fiber protein n=1 Tax=Panagrellus redivivus TaxID=6233 RepID=A0A7E4UNG3_PANRE
MTIRSATVIIAIGGADSGASVMSDRISLLSRVELRINTAPIESDTEAQLAAEKIVSSLQDGVEALNQVLAQHTSDASVSDSESGDIASDAAETGSQEDTMSEAGFVTAHESVDAPPDSEGTLTIDGKEVVPIAQQLTIKVEQQSMTDQPG